MACIDRTISIQRSISEVNTINDSISELKNATNDSISELKNATNNSISEIKTNFNIELERMRDFLGQELISINEKLTITNEENNRNMFDLHMLLMNILCENTKMYKRICIMITIFSTIIIILIILLFILCVKN